MPLAPCGGHCGTALLLLQGSPVDRQGERKGLALNRHLRRKILAHCANQSLTPAPRTLLPKRWQTLDQEDGLFARRSRMQRLVCRHSDDR